jgi:HAD superfamily hydrolase (TIGR01509 family)
MKVIFDVGNVIIKADHSLTYSYLESFGVSKEKAKLFFSNKEYEDFSRGEISEEEFCSSLNKYLEKNLSCEQLEKAHDIHIYGVDEQVIEILSSIKEDLFFLTDTNIWQTRREKELVNLNKFSDKIFRSHKVGFLKEDFGCFPFIIKELNEKPENLLLIDDSPEKIEMAKQNGLRIILFTNAEKLRIDLKNFLTL